MVMVHPKAVACRVFCQFLVCAVPFFKVNGSDLYTKLTVAIVTFECLHKVKFWQTLRSDKARAWPRS